MKTLASLLTVILSMLFISCGDQNSLQKYYVENQNAKDFIALDIPASMFANLENLDERQKKILKTIRKINFLAISEKKVKQELVEAEKAKVTEILKNEKYQLLAKYAASEMRMEVYFTGKEEAVEEIIAYGYKSGSGMGIARLLGNKMDPGEILGLMRSLETGDIELSGLKGITDLFVEKVPEEQATAE